MIRIVKVRGESMLPTLAEGDFLVVGRRYRTLKVGDLVLLNHAKYPQMVKRIRYISAEGRFLVEGDSPHSLSPEQIGWVNNLSLIHI